MKTLISIALVLVILFQLVESKQFKKHFLKSTKPSHSKYASECSQFKYFSQNIDHFRLDKSKNDQYQQRYILSRTHWRKNGPIFFYTGNEGDIEWFCLNTGFVWEIAEKFQAMVVFAEHRYYGKSMPYGDKSYQSPYIDYLTSEQALADYAYLVTSIKSNISDASNSSVIAFGGSYGGMLSAWARMKYPNLFDGALAASAPVWQFVTECNKFNEVITNAFKKADPLCPNIVRASWNLINTLGQTQDGLNQLTSIFKLCEPLKNIDDLKAWLNDVYGNIAMANYPYEANFLNTLPAWPVKVMCSRMVNSVSKRFDEDPASLLTSVFNGVNVYQNYTGQLKCTDIGTDVPSDISMTAWEYQTCTEFVFPFCSNGVTDMFEPQEWNYTSYVENCLSQFGVKPRMEWPIIFYGGSASDYKSHTNIIFSNGDLDPWSSGGVLDTINDNLVAILIEQGAHHLDLRASNSNDPKSVILARMKEIEIITSWLREMH